MQQLRYHQLLRNHSDTTTSKSDIELLSDGSADEVEEDIKMKRVTFVTTYLNSSCSDACTRAGRVCERKWFDAFNSCQVLREAFPSSKHCNSSLYRRDLPAYHPQDATVLVNSRQHRLREHATTCWSKFASNHRICGCGVLKGEVQLSISNASNGNSSISFHTPVHKRVSKILLNHLRGVVHLISKERRLQRQKADLVDDIKQARSSFVVGALQADCWHACSDAGLVCERQWFDVLNNCEVLHAAFPERTRCSVGVYAGRDVPAYRPGDRTVLVNSEARAFPSSCSGWHNATQRVCGCGRKALGAARLHTVYNVQATAYFEWQVRYMHLWFKQAKMPGQITRLLSADGPDRLMREKEVPTHVSVPYVSGIANDSYSPYNKPWAIMRWLAEDKPVAETILIVDPDCMFVDRLEVSVVENAPIAQQAFFSFVFGEGNGTGKDNVAAEVARRYCKGCTFVDAVAVPIMIHRKDLEKIAPLWLAKTLEMRRDRPNWAAAWSEATSSLGLGWTTEMFGYVFAAAELGIRHEIWNLQNAAPYDKRLTAPIIHYYERVSLSDGRSWEKKSADAASNIPWPVPPDTDLVSATTLMKLHEAYHILGPSLDTSKKVGRLGLKPRQKPI